MIQVITGPLRDYSAQVAGLAAIVPTPIQELRLKAIQEKMRELFPETPLRPGMVEMINLLDRESFPIHPKLSDPFQTVWTVCCLPKINSNDPFPHNFYVARKGHNLEVVFRGKALGGRCYQKKPMEAAKIIFDPEAATAEVKRVFRATMVFPDDKRIIDMLTTEIKTRTLHNLTGHFPVLEEWGCITGTTKPQRQRGSFVKEECLKVMFIEEFFGMNLHNFLYIHSSLFQDESFTLSIFIKILEHIAWMHQNRLVHCDLKWANILIKGDGSVRLTDLNFVSDDGSQSSLTKFSPSTADPQLLRKLATHRGDFTYRCCIDMWCFGAMLYPFFSQEIEKWTSLCSIQDQLCSALCSDNFIIRCSVFQLYQSWSFQFNLFLQCLNSSPHPLKSFFQGLFQFEGVNRLTSEVALEQLRAYAEFVERKKSEPPPAPIPPVAEDLSITLPPMTPETQMPHYLINIIQNEDEKEFGAIIIEMENEFVLIDKPASPSNVDQ